MIYAKVSVRSAVVPQNYVQDWQWPRPMKGDNIDALIHDLIPRTIQTLL